jgi:DNA-binding CsgD family transcriptional regulator
MIVKPKNPVIQSSPKLSKREIEVLSRAARGGSSREIADELFVSQRTVEFHLGNAYAKLGSHNRIQALQQARRLGVLGDEAASAK